MGRAIAALVLVLGAVAAAGAPTAAQDAADAIERQVTLARAALAAKQLDKANRHAEDAYALAVAALENGQAASDRVQSALAAAVEVRASAMVEDGARAEAVRFLRLELEAERTVPARAQLQATLDRVTLEGHAAPAFEPRMHLGPRVPGLDQLRGKVVLIFFWAHWCAQCKADGPMVERLLGKYRGEGLAIVAPTQRYGYAQGGRPAAPARELRHIVQVRDTSYPFLRHAPVPIGEANYKEYGVTTIPMYVLVDRQGIIRMYRPGRMTEDELEAAIRRLL